MGVVMMLFPAIMVGGHLMIAVMNKVPDVKFEQLCKEAASGNLGDSFDTCARDERAAHDQLAEKWTEFDAADRTMCVRMSASERISSYIELLTCLESAQYAKKLRPATIAAGDITAQIPGHAKETIGTPIRRIALSRHPAPAPPLSIESQPGPLPSILQLIAFLQHILNGSPR